MSSDVQPRSFSRSFPALAAAGLLGASLPIADGPGAVDAQATEVAAGPAFDPLLDTGPAGICGPVGTSSLKIPSPGWSPPSPRPRPRRSSRSP
jgi:hypothetical protein